VDKELESLIALSRSGNEAAFADLAVMYRPLIESMGKGYAAKDGGVLHTVDDFIQEANLAFYSAVMSYDPESPVGFGYYAKICIRNRLVSLLRASSAKAKKTSERVEKEKGYIEPVYGFLEREDAEQIEKKIEAVLSRFEWSVFSLYLQNKSYKEIAEALGRSEKNIDNALFRAKKKLKKLRD